MATIAVEDGSVLEFLRERYAGATSARALWSWAGMAPPAQPGPDATAPDAEAAWALLDAERRVALMTEAARDWPGQVTPLRWLAAASEARRAAEPPDPDATVKVDLSGRGGDPDVTVRVISRPRGAGPVHPDAVTVMRLFEASQQPGDIGVRLVSLMAAYLPRGPGAFAALAMALDRRLAPEQRDLWERELDELLRDQAWAAAAGVWRDALWCSRPAEEAA